MSDKLTKKFYASLTIFSLIGQIAWVIENMYFNVFIYKMFRASAAQISVMVAASAVTAAITTLLIGALSDKVGRRKIFLCAGYAFWGVSILSFGLIKMDVLTKMTGSVVAAATLGCNIVIILDCVMTFFGSSANDACFNAWLTDMGDETNRGKIEGINAMMPLLAVLVVFGSFMSFDLDKAEAWTGIFFIIGGVVIVVGGLGFFLIDDSKSRELLKNAHEENSHYFKNIFYSFKPSVIKQNYMLYVILAAFAVFNISIQIFMPYLILYYEQSLKLTNYVLIMAPAIIAAAIVTLFYGRVYDKFGFEKSVIPVVTTLMAGYVFLYFFTNIVLVFIGSLLMLSGFLAGMAVFGAMVRDNTPQNKTGMFQGVRIIAQVLIPGVIGPAIGAAVLKNADKISNGDGTESFIPNHNIYLAAFIAGLFIFLAVWGVSCLKKKNSTN